MINIRRRRYTESNEPFEIISENITFAKSNKRKKRELFMKTTTMPLRPMS